jgi:hypothetical protein
MAKPRLKQEEEKGVEVQICTNLYLLVISKSCAGRVGRVGACPLVGWEVGTFRHGQNPPPSGVGDATLPLGPNA